MNWDAIAALGQAVSALALMFVLMQLRYAREEMKRAAVLTRLEGTRDLFLQQAADEGLVLAMARAETAAGTPLGPLGEYFTRDLGLTETEARRIAAYAMATWQNFEASIESISRLSPGVRREVDNAIKRNYEISVLAKWFEIAKNRLNPDAVRYVENLLAQPG
jgi:hypothetical protein